MTDGGGLGAVTFGLLASLSWGASDFSGGLSTRRVHVFGVITVSYVAGLALLVALALAWSEPIPSGDDLAWGGAAGLAGVTGLTAQYRALAVGRMGIVAPVAAVLGTAVPVLVAALTEGLPGASQMVGFVLAIAGVWIIARPELSGGRTDGLGLAVLAGLGFGAFFIMIDRVSEGAVFWPLVAARGTSFVVMALIVMTSRVAWRPGRNALPLILVAGALDVGGNTFFLLAAQAGRLDVSSVMSSLYPMVTVLLARLVLHEHVTRLQAAGIIAAVVAIPLIAT
jgi:drug/metabolite transporter (DMT)-like permease